MLLCRAGACGHVQKVYVLFKKNQLIFSSSFRNPFLPPVLEVASRLTPQKKSQCLERSAEVQPLQQLLLLKSLTVRLLSLSASTRNERQECLLVVSRKLEGFACQKGVAELAKPSWARGVLEYSMCGSLISQV